MTASNKNNKLGISIVLSTYTENRLFWFSDLKIARMFHTLWILRIKIVLHIIFYKSLLYSGCISWVIVLLFHSIHIIVIVQKHILEFYILGSPKPKKGFLENICMSVASSRVYILIKFTPKLYFGPKFRQKKLFWKRFCAQKSLKLKFQTKICLNYKVSKYICFSTEWVWSLVKLVGGDYFTIFTCSVI